MPAYPHPVDQAWARKRYEQRLQDVERAARGLARARDGGTLDAARYDVAIQVPIDIVHLGWATGVPVNGLRPHLHAAISLISAALSDPRIEPGPREAKRWLTAALLTRRQDLARPLATSVLKGLSVSPTQSDASQHYLRGLAHLTLGHRPEASTAALVLTEALASPETVADLASSLAHLDDLLVGAAASDVASLREARIRREQAVGAYAAESVESSRDTEVMLDSRAMAVLATLPDDTLQAIGSSATTPLELIAE